MNTYITGFKFKETHPEIHYLINEHAGPRDDYDSNYSRDVEHARAFASADEAEDCIMEMMQHVERDRDYRWTPIIINSATGESKTIISSKWH